MTNQQANRQLIDSKFNIQTRTGFEPEHNDNRYRNYCHAARELGWPIKTYEEWLNS